MARKKVLLMGKAHSGKTSMRSIIFANYLARDTMRLSPTLDVEHHHVRFLGDLVLNLWDCGGQDAFYESYFERDRETIFRSVELLIYVFDIASECPEKDFDHFSGVLEAIEENSPDARIFVLVHKMDLVAKEEQEMILEDRTRLIAESCDGCGVHNFQCFGTSIWDETLYKAWSEIVRYLIPNISVLQTHLEDFCRVCDADEVVLFEKATFLVISHSSASSGESGDANGGRIEGEGDANADGAGATNNSALTGGGEDGNNMEGTTVTVGAQSTGTGNVTANTENVLSTDTATAPVSTTTDGIEDDTDEEQHNAPISNIHGAEGSFPPDDAQDNYSEVTTERELDSTLTPSNNGQNIVNETGADTTAMTNNAVNNNTPEDNDANAQHKGHGPPGHFDTHRFEKISNIVKQFKLSCEKAQSQFQGMEVSNSRFSAFIDAFTENTYIMVIVSNPNVHTAATLMNIKNARGHFERFIPRS